MGKIQSCKICHFCIHFYYKRKFAPLSRQKWCKFPLVIQKYTKLANFARLYFLHFSTFHDQFLQFYYFGYALFSCSDGFCFSCFNKNLAKHWNCPLNIFQWRIRFLCLHVTWDAASYLIMTCHLTYLLCYQCASH